MTGSGYSGTPLKPLRQECESRRAMKDDPRHSFVSIDGMRLHWAEVGDATDKAPVVLLHGILDAHLTWKVVGSALATDRRVLMPDLVGCGLSDRPDASYELGWHAQAHSVPSPRSLRRFAFSWAARASGTY